VVLPASAAADFPSSSYSTGVPLDDFIRDFRVDRRVAAAVLLAAGQTLCTTAGQRSGCSQERSASAGNHE